MSPKQSNMRRALMALYLQVPAEVAQAVTNAVMDAVEELEAKLRAARTRIFHFACPACGHEFEVERPFETDRAARFEPEHCPRCDAPLDRGSLESAAGEDCD